MIFVKIGILASTKKQKMGYFGLFWAILGHIGVILGPIALGHWGLFWAYLKPISHKIGYPKWLEWPKIWYSGIWYDHSVPVGACFSPVWLTKTTWMIPNLVQWDRVWPYCTSKGLWWLFFTHFEPFWIKQLKQTSTTEDLALRPKVAPKCPHQHSMVIPCPTVPDLGPFKSFWVAKWVRNRS